MKINEDDLLRECMNSGQMGAEQVMQHWGAGELTTQATASDGGDQYSLLEARVNSRRFTSHVKTTLDQLAKELGISHQALRESVGSWHQLPSGVRVMLLDAQTRQRLAREEREKVLADLGAKMLDDFMGAAQLDVKWSLNKDFGKFGTTIDESTEVKPFLLSHERKTCLSCGAKQAADGTLSCGH